MVVLGRHSGATSLGFLCVLAMLGNTDLGLKQTILIEPYENSNNIICESVSCPKHSVLVEGALYMHLLQ